MKVRTDFVTNSSSALYVVDLQLKSDQDRMAEYRILTDDIGTRYDGCDPRDERFELSRHAKSFDLTTPRGTEDDIILGVTSLSKATTLEELIEGMLSCVHLNLYSGGMMSGFRMPQAVDALAIRCAEQDITRENLRIIGAQIRVQPWGDSVWEVDDYYDQWCVNVPAGEVKSTGRKLWRRGGYPSWDPTWQDSVWWPFTGTPYAIPYDQIASGAVGKHKVRHLDLTSLQNTQLTSMKSMFRGYRELQEIDLMGIDTSQVTDMSGLFADCDSLRELDLSGLDTSQVTDMSEMFDGCDHLIKLNLSGLDTSRVTDMHRLLYRCRRLGDLDYTGLDTSHVTNMREMFAVCDRFGYVYLDDMDTSSVTDMSKMFAGCERLRKVDLSQNDTSQVTTMEDMFFNCPRLQSVDFSGCNASSLKNTTDMFDKCKSINRWSVSATWPVRMDGAIPKPTAKNGKWWSKNAGTWMTVSEIRARGPVTDTYTSKPDEE